MIETGNRLKKFHNLNLPEMHFGSCQSYCDAYGAVTVVTAAGGASSTAAYFCNVESTAFCWDDIGLLRSAS